MSIYFSTSGGRDVWNPSNMAARLFRDQVESAAKIIAIETGLGPVISDEVTIDEEKFIAFANAFAELVINTDPVSSARALLENCFGIVGALAEKMGATFLDKSEISRLVANGRRNAG